MNRIPPSNKIRKEIEEFFKQGLGWDKKYFDTLIRLGTQRIIQEILENEIDNHLGRGRYERTSEHIRVFGMATRSDPYVQQKVKFSFGYLRCGIPMSNINHHHGNN